ncbi:MAG TPA: 50S ribosomal protein L3 [Clostridiaceae bacterium]|jgi:large subunit ribosomal protein L3|nr:50S ribosomal protein L3 [Clostridiaceae bacterium]
MKKCMIGRKIGMTQVFAEDGIMIPVTVVLAGPMSVIQKKTVEIDGYNAVKFGFEDIPDRKANKPMKGQFEKAGVSPKRVMREFKLDDISAYEVGKVVKVEDMFEAGERVDISGISKGKGFQGTVKRYRTARGRMTHGSGYHRGIGALAGSASPGRILKGRKMPGHMGAEKVTVQNLTVVKVDAERGLLLVKGAVPGAKGGLLVIKDSVKAK